MVDTRPRCATCTQLDVNKVVYQGIDRVYRCPTHVRRDTTPYWFVDKKIACLHYNRRKDDLPYYVIVCKSCGKRQIKPWQEVMDMSHNYGYEPNDALLITYYTDVYTVVNCSCGNSGYTILQRS